MIKQRLAHFINVSILICTLPCSIVYGSAFGLQGERISEFDINPTNVNWNLLSMKSASNSTDYSGVAMVIWPQSPICSGTLIHPGGSSFDTPAYMITGAAL